MLQNSGLWEALVPLDHLAFRGCAAVVEAADWKCPKSWEYLMGDNYTCK